MTRRLLLASVSGVCALLLLVGCGDGGSTTATPTPSPSATSLTAAQARSVAAAGVLTAADLPGYKVTTQKAESLETREAVARRKCVGGASPKPVARNPGLRFTNVETGVVITSSVVVGASAKAALSELDALSSARSVTCFKRELARSTAMEGGTLRTSEVTRAATTIPGADAAFALLYDVEMIARNKSRMAFRAIVLSAVVGQAIVLLSVVKVAGPTPSLAEAEGLLTASVARMRDPG